jgi:hypothetical protein
VTDMLNRVRIVAALLGLCLLSGLADLASAQEPKPRAKGVNDALPDPDGKAADVSRTVKVFILMGQSNMLEMGKVAGDVDGTLEHAVKKEGLYPFLVDDAGQWTTRKDVRNVAVMGSGGPEKNQVRVNGWMTVAGGKIGVEMGIGHHLGNALEEPVLILKSAIACCRRDRRRTSSRIRRTARRTCTPATARARTVGRRGPSRSRSAGKRAFSTTGTWLGPRRC